METLDKDLAEYAGRYIKELKDEALRNLINASFRESLIPSIRERQEKNRELILTHRGRITELEEAGKEDRKIAYENSKTIRGIEKTITAIEAYITRDDKRCEDMKESADSMRADAQKNFVQIAFMLENPAKPLEQFKELLDAMEADARGQEGKLKAEAAGKKPEAEAKS